MNGCIRSSPRTVLFAVGLTRSEGTRKIQLGVRVSNGTCTHQRTVDCLLSHSFSAVTPFTVVHPLVRNSRFVVSPALHYRRHVCGMVGHEANARWKLDPFTYALMFQKSQVILVGKFMDALRKGHSMCHQMIMGAGKTTVVIPLCLLSCWSKANPL